MFNVIEKDHSYEGNFISIDPDTNGIGFGDDILGTLRLKAGISLYDPTTKIGILTNIDGNHKYYSPEKVVDIMIENLSRYTGVNLSDLEASICCDEAFDSPEYEKFQKIKKRFNELNIKIIGNDISDCFPNKSMFLNCENGNVEVYRPKSL
jgi:hypothetical protein